MVDVTLLDDKGGRHEKACSVDTLVIAGWAGRDAQAVEAHIEELAAIGVPRPSQVPLFYRVGPDRLVMDERLTVLGNATSGEVEAVLLGSGEGTMLAVGSDHTDRELEQFSVAHAKQQCGKPVSRFAWRLSDVIGHWDQLVLRSWAVEDGMRTLYQEQTIDALLHPDDLLARYLGGPGTLPTGTVMFCGTVPVRGAIRPMERFEVELEDPVLRRSLFHGYDVVCVPAHH